MLFGRQHLEVVSDTVSHSFGRAFATGLLGQILLLPTFGMLVVGLILSVVGIVLLPFAVVVYVLLVFVGGLGGYLAVAHAMGETYTRRRMALGVMLGSPNSYRYLLVGLGALAALWLAWALFGWVPVAGELIRGAAILVTWLLGTAGFGAALLSRAGLRENFAGPAPPARGADRRVPVGHPAVRRERGQAARRPDAHTGPLMRRLLLAALALAAGPRAPTRRRCARSAPTANGMARPGCTPGWSTPPARSGSRPAAPASSTGWTCCTTASASCRSATSTRPEAAVALGLRAAGEGGLRVVSKGQLRQTAAVTFSPEERSRARCHAGRRRCRPRARRPPAHRPRPSRPAPAGPRCASPTPNAARCRAAPLSAGAAELTVLGLGNSRCERIAFEGGVGRVTLDFGGTWTSELAGRSQDGARRSDTRAFRDRWACGSRSTSSSRSFDPQGLVRQGTSYISPGYDQAARHLDIDLTTAMGKVRVVWEER